VPFIFPVIFHFFGQLPAQQGGNFFFGKLVDVTTKEPIVFATVRVKGKALGVISNNDGGFKVPRDFRNEGNVLVISSMGYETKEISFSNLKEGIINVILIRPYTFELSETVVTAKKRRSLTKVKNGLSAEQIIKLAIANFPNNYDVDPFELVGYYRDYQLRKKQYTNLNEALTKVYDQGFSVKNHMSMQFGLYSYNANSDFEVDSFAAKPYDYLSNDKYIPDAVFRQQKIPNELTLLFNHDAIRNHSEQTYSYVNTFENDFIKGHDFYTFFLTNFGDKEIYKIKFKKQNGSFQVRGDIYIDGDTYAIRKLDYAVYRKMLNGPSNDTSSKTEGDLLYEILVEYQNYNNKMYLNYISFHNQFKLIRPPKFFIEEAIVDKITKQVTLVLNKPARNWLELKPKDFKVYYKGSRLRVKKVIRVGDTGDTYTLSFDKKGKPIRKRINLLISEEEDRKKASLAIIITKMVDAEGNLVAERKSETLDQFREFFTQKIILGRSNTDDYGTPINKTISLGHEGQPKILNEMELDFWMNTPLKSKP